MHIFGYECINCNLPGFMKQYIEILKSIDKDDTMTDLLNY